MQYYFDLNGQRPWPLLGAIDVLTVEQPPSSGTLFIHYMDLFRLRIGEIQRPEATRWRQALNRGDFSHLDVSIVSGLNRFEDTVRAVVYQECGQHSPDRITFVAGVRHGIGVEALRALLKGHDDTIAAFRILWEAFVCARCDEALVPPPVRMIRPRLANVVSAANYWRPVQQPDGQWLGGLLETTWTAAAIAAVERGDPEAAKEANGYAERQWKATSERDRT